MSNIKLVGLDVCPYCRGENVFITDMRHEYEQETHPRDLACQDMECESCSRIWTVEHRPVCYFQYSPDQTFIDTPHQLLPAGE